jgi:hypothetical protein
MKLNLLLLVIFASVFIPSSRAGNEDLRAFVLPSDQQEANAVGSHKDGLIYADQEFLLAHSRNGVEVGKNVPAVWLTKPGFKWRTYLVSERFGVGAIIKHVEVIGGKICVEFSFPHEKQTEIYTVPVIVRDDIGLIFLQGVGLEVQPIGQ